MLCRQVAGLESFFFYSGFDSWIWFHIWLLPTVSAMSCMMQNYVWILTVIPLWQVDEVKIIWWWYVVDDDNHDPSTINYWHHMCALLSSSINALYQTKTKLKFDQKYTSSWKCIALNNCINMMFLCVLKLTSIIKFVCRWSKRCGPVVDPNTTLNN